MLFGGGVSSSAAEGTHHDQGVAGWALNGILLLLLLLL
jgi:hypothetical protein